MPGVVTSILVKEGDLVSPGKILAVLDGATIRKGMDEVKLDCPWRIPCMKNKKIVGTKHWK